jgi:hypothetical protein
VEEEINMLRQLKQSILKSLSAYPTTLEVIIANLKLQGRFEYFEG